MPPIDTHTVAVTSKIDPALSLTHTLREAARHGERAVLLCSFQKEESVLLDELLRLDQGTGKAVRIVTIDTGVLFPETLQTWRAFEERFGVKIEVQDASSPSEPWSGPEHCCSVAKVAALESALAGAEGWITGIRREQGPTRADDGADRTRREARPVEVQPARPLDRQGPVAADPRARPALQPAARPGLRVDRLRAVHAARRGREGRWAGTDKTECGLHVEVSRALMSVAARPQLSHLRALESEAIHVMREVAAEFERPVLLFSGGKDSIVLLRLAEKAFRPAPFPFPLMHVDTGHNFPEVIEFRDRRVAELGERLIVASVQESIDKRPRRSRRPGRARRATSCRR